MVHKTRSRITTLALDTYFPRILEQLGVSTRISRDAKEYLNDLIVRVLHRACLYLVVLAEHATTRTISSRDANTATRLIFHGELGKRAVSEGTKAVTRFVSYNKRKSSRTASKDKANLILPPSRFRAFLSECAPDHRTDIRISPNAVIYLTAVIEYLLAEILEISAKDSPKITSEIIRDRISQDDEVSKTICHI